MQTSNTQQEWEKRFDGLFSEAFGNSIVKEYPVAITMIKEFIRSYKILWEEEAKKNGYSVGYAEGYLKGTQDTKEAYL
jgi:hypothetical protein